MVKKDRIGEIFKVSNGENVTIIEYNNAKNVVVEFSDGYKTTCTIGCLKKGFVRNPFIPTVCGIGYFGKGNHFAKVDKKFTKVYRTWYSMLNRCYSEKFHEKQSEYKDCEVDEYWHNFQNFGDWYEQNWKNWMDSSWHLDKDILVKGNKIYSPNTCCFVPKEVNNLLIKSLKSKGENSIGVQKRGDKFRPQMLGKSFKSELTEEGAFQVYKQAKEQRIKEVVNKWKGLIDDKVYEILYNYEVENLKK